MGAEVLKVLLRDGEGVSLLAAGGRSCSEAARWQGLCCFVQLISSFQRRERRVSISRKA